jgi:hypothetical protein
MISKQHFVARGAALLRKFVHGLFCDAFLSIPLGGHCYGTNAHPTGWTKLRKVVHPVGWAMLRNIVHPVGWTVKVMVKTSVKM